MTDLASELPRAGDALVLVDVQNDFLPGGSLGVTDGHAIIAPLNQLIAMFSEAGLPVVATRDWHPDDHTSFHEQDGPWPPHCVQGTHGAQFHQELAVPEDALIISKAHLQHVDAYSGFAGTDLHQRLQELDVDRLFVGGLATDYCVLNTVLDARAHGYQVMLLTDAIRAVEVCAGDGQKAIERMVAVGARPMQAERIGSR